MNVSEIIIAHWPIMYVASVFCIGRNARPRCAFVLEIIAAFAAHQWTSTVLDGRCIHEFIMPSSRTKTESESADFFLKPAETHRLQDFENRNNTRSNNVTESVIH